MRAQLLTAIELFFADADPVSVHTLAGASREMLESLCRIEGIEPMTDFILRDHPGRRREDIWNAMNLYRNCFKHVGKTAEERAVDQSTLSQFSETDNDFLLYVCVEDYVRLRHAMPVDFQVLHAWFADVHMDLQLDPSRVESFRRLFPGMAQQSRVEQKRRGGETIRAWAHNRELLADPQTEPRDLT